MLDIKYLRENPQTCNQALQAKVSDASLDSVLSLDKALREIKARVDEYKAERNTLSQAIGEKKRAGEDAEALMQSVTGIGEAIDALDSEYKEKEAAFHEAMGYLPNLPDPDIPRSPDPKDNRCVKTFGEKPTFSFPFRNHLKLNEHLKLFDFKRGAKISGSGWPVYTNMGARLEWALLQYMLDTHLQNGFTPWMTPLLVRPEIMHGSAQLPKFKGQFYELRDEGNDLYLIPTAETALNGLHRDEIIPDEELPLKYVAYSPCFRREAGAAGAQERGLIRTHQFNKVEMFCFTRPEESDLMFDSMITSAEEILEGLELHYRRMLLVTGDTAFAAAKTVDMEVWLPGQERYYEVSSISNCRDFQARRSKIRRRKKGEKPEFLHTLNGSGLATSRLMVALLENNQREDGSVAIPHALRPYLDNISVIEAP